MDCGTIVATVIGAFSLFVAAWAFIVSIMRRHPIVTPCHDDAAGPECWFVNNANSQYPIVVHCIDNQTDYEAHLGDAKNNVSFAVAARHRAICDIYLGPGESCKIGYGGTILRADDRLGTINKPRLTVDKKKSGVSWLSYIWPTGENQYVRLVLSDGAGPAGADNEVKQAGDT